MGGGTIQHTEKPMTQKQKNARIIEMLEQNIEYIRQLANSMEKANGSKGLDLKSYPYYKLGLASHLIGKKVWVRNTIYEDWHGPVTLTAIEESNVPYVVDRKRDSDFYPNYRLLME